MLKIKPEPSFERFLDTLLMRRHHRRPPMFDFHVAPEHKARLLGREVRTPADDVKFFRQAGYDYVQCTVFVPSRELEEAIASSQGRASSHASNLAVIQGSEHYRSRRWSWQAATDGDLSCIGDRLAWLCELRSALPADMKIVLHTADVFTLAWQMMGFEAFCLATVEDPGFVEELMDSLAAAQINATRVALDTAEDSVGALFYSDDIAYTEGLLLGPGFFRQRLFPVMARFAELGRESGAPLIYHSDGRLYDVLADLYAAGVRGIQPLEPKSMDPLEIRRRLPGRFCLIGNIDLDLMSRGTPGDVERHVRERIERLNAEGGYMPGVSNTVPDYVKHENYVRMIETVYSCGP